MHVATSRAPSHLLISIRRTICMPAGNRSIYPNNIFGRDLGYWPRVIIFNSFTHVCKWGPKEHPTLEHPTGPHIYHIYICIYMHIHIHMHIQIHIHMHIHNHIYTITYTYQSNEFAIRGQSQVRKLFVFQFSIPLDNFHLFHRKDYRKTLPLNGPLARYVKLRVAHAPEMPGTFSPPSWVSDPNMHNGTCVTHVS